MDRLPTRAADCQCDECDRRHSVQFIHGLDNEGMIGEMLWEITALENIDDAAID